MGNSSYGAGHQNGIDDGYDMAKSELKERNGINFDDLMKIGKTGAKIINALVKILKK